MASVSMLPSSVWAMVKNGKLRTAHIGVGGMGAADLGSIASHPKVEITALCDVDSNALNAAQKLYPDAKIFSDYRKLFNELGNEIDAVIVSTPDHTHAPASIMAMEMDKAVYCQKPLTHHVSEARAVKKLAEEKNLPTQMGIQIHSFKEYRSAVKLIQEGIIGIRFPKTSIGISGLELHPKDLIKTKSIIRGTGENYWIMVVVHWVIWVFIYLTRHMQP